MLGAIIGDIVGSIYEPKDRRIKTKDFPFFSENCRFTDDSVCTVAVADALLHNLPPAETMRKWGENAIRSVVSAKYSKHGFTPNPIRKHLTVLFGTGAAMRVSPAAFLKP